MEKLRPEEIELIRISAINGKKFLSYTIDSLVDKYNENWDGTIGNEVYAEKILLAYILQTTN